jgi:hypothetical protein
VAHIPNAHALPITRLLLLDAANIPHSAGSWATGASLLLVTAAADAIRLWALDASALAGSAVPRAPATPGGERGSLSKQAAPTPASKNTPAGLPGSATVATPAPLGSGSPSSLRARAGRMAAGISSALSSTIAGTAVASLASANGGAGAAAALKPRRHSNRTAVRLGIDLVGDLVAHSDTVLALLATPSGQLVSASADCQAIIWHNSARAWAARAADALRCLQADNAADRVVM